MVSDRRFAEMLLWTSVPFAAESRKELAEMGESRTEVVARDNERDGQDDQHDAAGDARREGLAEDRDTEKDCRDGFQCSENGGGRRSDVLDGARGAEERNGGRKEREGQQIAPQIPTVGHDERFAAGDAGDEEQQSGREDVEGDGQCGNLPQARHPCGDDIDGVGEGRGQHEQRTCQTQRRPVGAPVEQPDPAACQQDAESGHGREPF